MSYWLMGVHIISVIGNLTVCVFLYHDGTNFFGIVALILVVETY